MNKKLFSAVILVALIMSSFFTATSVLASATIIETELNGLNNTTAKPGDLIEATVRVQLTGQSAWKSTEYKFEGENWRCVNTSDYIGKIIATETFPVIAPTKVGTSKIYFNIYSGNNCSNNVPVSAIAQPASFLTSAINILSSGIYNNLLVILSITLIMLMGLFATLYSSRKIKEKSEEDYSDNNQ